MDNIRAIVGFGMTSRLSQNDFVGSANERPHPRSHLSQHWLHLTLQRAAFLFPARGGGQAGVALDTKGQVLDAPAARPLLAVPTAGTGPEV
jgi:hypothetical protein